VELGSYDLDVLQTPVCWAMMEKQCDANTQQKLVDYVKEGGKLILAGRMCIEDFNHAECTILKDAIGIEQIEGDLPFVQNTISVFNYHDVPVSFLETYTGKFDEVFAKRENGAVAGFLNYIGEGKVMMIGAALAANTLDDLDIVHQMALKMDCQPLFALSNWADVRLSRGEKGSFLFINNYQDDPVETTIEYEKEIMLGGNSVYLPARRGLILPIDWRLRKDLMIHYATSEITEITDDGSMIILRTEQDDFFAEMTFSGYHCDHSETIKKTATDERVRLHGKEGAIFLRKDG
jgi:beta-galactosidase